MAFRTKETRKLTVYVEGQLISLNRLELKEIVSRAMAKKWLRKLVLDFARCGYIDSSGLGTLISISRMARENGVLLTLRGLNDDLRTLFELNKLDTIFDFEDHRA